MKKLLTCFLLICFGHLHAQNQAKIDSLLEVFETLTSEREKADMMILLARQYSRANPELTIEYAERAIDYAQQANYQEGISDAYYGIGWVQMKGGDYTSSTTSFQKALDIAQSSEYEKGKANAFNGLGIINRNKGNLEEALKFYFDAFDIYTTIEDQSGLSSSHNSLAIVYHIKGDIENALKHFKSSLSIDDSLGNQFGVASSYNNIGRVYQSQGEFPSALDHYIKSLRIKEKIGDKRGIAGSYTNIGIVYKDQSDWEKALDYFLKAVEIQQTMKDKRYIGASYTNIGSIHEELGADSLALSYYFSALEIQHQIGDRLGLSKTNILIGENYSRQSQYKEALKYLEKGLQTGRETDAKENIASALNGLGRVHWSLKNLRQAKGHLAEGIAVARAFDFPMEIRNGAEILAQVEKALGNYALALKAYELYHVHYDSLLGEEKAKQLSQLEVQYETEKKEQEIERLADQAAIQTLKLEQSGLYFVISAIALVVLIMLGVVFYLIHRQKQFALNQKNHDIEQKLLRVQMNPHFIFNAMSSIQDFMVQGNGPQASIYLAKFSKMIRQVLDSSRSEFISLEQEVSMLENYLSLQNIRRDRPFEYKIEIEEGLIPEEVAIPPMFAQPFVENAIEHGMTTLEDGAFVEIKFSVAGDFLTLKITDNGVGIEESTKVKRSDKHVSHATQITRERIELFRLAMQKNIGFNIKSLSPGTEVSINLPFQWV